MIFLHISGFYPILLRPVNHTTNTEIVKGRKLEIIMTPLYLSPPIFSPPSPVNFIPLEFCAGGNQHPPVVYLFFLSTTGSIQYYEESLLMCMWKVSLLSQLFLYLLQTAVSWPLLRPKSKYISDMICSWINIFM